jgi:dTDP-glucose 4,6-dehydratase/UDP-glucose 4-epimerase
MQSDFQDRRVLITGGLGFIGSNLAHSLVAMGAQVTLIDSLVPQYGGNLFNISGIESLVQVNISDVRDPHSLRVLVRDQDFLFNLAGQTSHLDSMINPEIDLEINCKAQLTVLEACRHENPKIRVVFASTRQIYGKPEYLPVDEKHPINPVDVNGINKTAGEWYHLLYSRVYGIPTTVLRLTNTYGPRMRVKDARQTFLGIWMRNIIEGNPFKIFGDGMQLRDFNYVDDVVDALLIAATDVKAVGNVFNLGGAERVSLLNVANQLAALHPDARFELIPFPADRKAIDIGDYYTDYAKISRELGWHPRVDLIDGLRLTLDYFQVHHSRYWSNDDPVQ